MPDERSNVSKALEAIGLFTGSDLTSRIAHLEWLVKGCDGPTCLAKAEDAGVTSALLQAAYVVKRAAGQIHVIIHTVGTMLLLPRILQPGEKIEYVSLGAGNMGKEHDLATDKRIAEFKFIHWRGGAETARKRALFSDFYRLAKAQTPRRKELYLLGTTHPLRFLRSTSALDSVMSRNVGLLADFRKRHGDAYQALGDFYAAHQDHVFLVDASPLVPELMPVVKADEPSEDQAEQE